MKTTQPVETYKNVKIWLSDEDHIEYVGGGGHYRVLSGQYFAQLHDKNAGSVSRFPGTPSYRLCTSTDLKDVKRAIDEMEESNRVRLLL